MNQASLSPVYWGKVLDSHVNNWRAGASGVCVPPMLRSAALDSFYRIDGWKVGVDEGWGR